MKASCSGKEESQEAASQPLPSSFFPFLMESLPTEFYLSIQANVFPTPALLVCALFGRVGHEMKL